MGFALHKVRVAKTETPFESPGSATLHECKHFKRLYHFPSARFHCSCSRYYVHGSYACMYTCITSDFQWAGLRPTMLCTTHYSFSMNLAGVRAMKSLQATTVLIIMNYTFLARPIFGRSSGTILRSSKKSRSVLMLGTSNFGRSSCGKLAELAGAVKQMKLTMNER